MITNDSDQTAAAGLHCRFAAFIPFGPRESNMHSHFAAFVYSLLAGLLFVTSGVAATPTNKCVLNGAVTYQQGPCPSGEVQKQPTLEELNAHAKRRRAAAPAAVPASPAPATLDVLGGSRCDGRKYCSQMTSCAEAKYFLANCPGVKMDGNKDGSPCQKQWCGR
ncbi:MAG: excalibur calcium-binding domain-containing protein [Polaromonas sp.]|nr:excalibur calcium-binding domain-containing protein [Polaromonas sp.]